jgi:hypothetical protein
MFGKRMKVREIGGNLTMTIPRDVGDYFKIVRGTELDVFCEGQRLIVDLTTAERTKLFDPPPRVPELA